MAEDFNEVTINDFDIIDMNENAIKSLYASLEDVEPGSEQCKQIIGCIRTLQEQNNEYLKIAGDQARFDKQVEHEKKENKKRRIVDYLKIGATLITFGAGAFLTQHWRNEDMQFEETGHMFKSTASKTTRKLQDKNSADKMSNLRF